MTSGAGNAASPGKITALLAQAAADPASVIIHGSAQYARAVVPGLGMDLVILATGINGGVGEMD